MVTGAIPAAEFALREAVLSDPVDALKDAFGWAELVLCAPGRHLPEDVLAAGRSVELIQLWSSGYDKINVGDARRHGIPVANNGGSNAVAVAEHAILLMLAVARRLPEVHQRTVNGRWQGNAHGLDMTLLWRRKLGLLGLGAIGRLVAERAAAFGMDIMYSDMREIPKTERGAVDAFPVDRETLLREADVLSLHLPLDDTTRGIIGARELARMKPSAILVNVSRADLVDRDALTEALRRGAIMGAGLDVHFDEPTLAGDPLLLLPGIVATHHVAGTTRDTYRHTMDHCLANFRRVAAGQAPLWVVN